MLAGGWQSETVGVRTWRIGRPAMAVAWCSEKAAFSALAVVAFGCTGHIEVLDTSSRTGLEEILGRA